MSTGNLLIGSGNLNRAALTGQVAVVTGAGRGIGFEASRALAWLGARVIVAEVDPDTGAQAAAAINREMGAEAAVFIRTDVGDEADVEQLARETLQKYGRVDIVLNNATAAAAMGAVKDLPIGDWDTSYRVNLRGPVLLARAFLPGMLERDSGVIVCVSSVGEAYMGAYESFKAAQVHLARTLDAELEKTGVIAFTIGPGLVRTPGALAGIEKLAPLYGKTVEEFFDMSQEHIISVESAGAGFAAAIALAPQFRGMEIDSRVGLAAAGITLAGEETTYTGAGFSEQESERVLALCRRVRETIQEQAEGWTGRPLFERQWMFRNFKKLAGMPVDQWLETLEKMEKLLEESDGKSAVIPPAPVMKLVLFYDNLQKLSRGYIKNPVEAQKVLEIIQGWQDEAGELAALLEKRV